MSEEEILAEQLAYYRARAREYDEWFSRRGRYDRGPELNARWHDQVGQVRADLGARLHRLGWDISVRRTRDYVLFGQGTRSS